MLWYNENNPLDIVFANINVVMSFENNSSVMTLNGIEFDMRNRNWQELKVEFVDGRSMIPFKYISELLDLEVD